MRRPAGVTGEPCGPPGGEYPDRETAQQCRGHRWGLFGGFKGQSRELHGWGRMSQQGMRMLVWCWRGTGDRDTVAWQTKMRTAEAASLWGILWADVREHF